MAYIILNFREVNEMVTALIMAGGKGSRMDFKSEKPLIMINNKPMIQYVIDALNESKKVNDIIVATSKNTPETDKFLKEIGIKTFVTPGEDYVHDLRFNPFSFCELRHYY